MELYDKCHGLQETTTDELVGVVLSELSSVDKTFLLIDALDECLEVERKLFFKIFFKSTLAPSLTLLITSRSEPDIQGVLKKSVSHSICIQSSLVDADVRTHVRNVISQDPTLQNWKPVIRQEILDGMVDGAHGM
jgi:hypothetical protein